jgi:hypothetical protein
LRAPPLTHTAFEDKWEPAVKMIKKWNDSPTSREAVVSA